MYILIRKISPYTGADIVLGIFCNKSQAEITAGNYLSHYYQHLEDDPWKDQAYVDENLSTDQIIIEEYHCECISGQTVFLVSHYSEAFGQVVRSIDKVFKIEKEADERCQDLENEENDFPGYALYQKIRIGDTLSDANENQPHTIYFKNIL